VGFCFKVSAVPFQAWTPDVYVGAPTSVTAFMSVGTKVAAFGALARVFMVALHPVADQWTPVLWAVAVLTMVGGNVLAVSQRDVKRMLAYSSVANAGYILVAVVVDTHDSLTALLVYLAAYAAMNLGAFGGVLAVERDNGLGTTLDDFTGLARRRPGLAATMALFLFALAGIPATVGFVGKFNVFYAAITGGHLELAIIGVLASVLGMFYYLRVIWAMYFVTPAPVVEPAASVVEARTAEPPVARGVSGAVAVAEPVAKVAAARVTVAVETARPRVTAGVWLALALAAALTLALGIIPAPLFDLARQAASTLLK
jgi:NADH-quinone oxidoreductase subunit N